MAESVYNPLIVADEIIFKDVDGQFMVLRGETVEPWHAIPRPAVVTAVPVRLLASPRSDAAPLDPLVSQVVKELALPFADAVLRQRLWSFVLSRFKDIRDEIEIREALERPVKVGGLGLPPPQAEQAIGIIERHFERWIEGRRRQQDQAVAALQANVGNMAPPVMAPAMLQPTFVMPSATIPQRSAPLRPLPPPPPAAVPLPPLGMVSRPPPALRHDVPQTPSIPPVTAPAPRLEPPPPLAPRTVPTPAAVVAPEQPPLMPPIAPPQAAAVPAVRYRPQLVGPLEEIRQMTLLDFRRLDVDPHQATAHVREKIALLEQQSFAHKAAAIAAWRASVVFARYTAAAAAAMAGKIPITDVLPSGPTDPDTLSVAEFEAVADFNRTLRF